MVHYNQIRWMAGASEKLVSLPPILALGGIALMVLAATKASSFGMPSLDDLGAVFLASTLSSIGGFAFSAICGAMLFHLLDNPVKVVQVMMVCSIAMQFFSVITLRNAIDWKHLSRFLAGGIAGLPLGVFLLTHLAAAQYMKIIGLFLVVYGCYMLLRRPVSKVFANSIGDYVAGFLGGLTGGFAAFPGAFVTIWCGWKGWSKDRQRGVYQPFILIMQVLALGLITVLQSSHSLRSTIDLSTLSYVPGALLGTWVGIAIFRRLTDRQFAGAVNVLLIVSGIGLLV